MSTDTLPGGTTSSYLGVVNSPFDWKRLGGFTAWLLIKASYGVDEAWYFTNAIAASSLQNSSSTITPSSNVMWSMLREKKKTSRESGLAHTKTSRGSWRIRNVFTHMGPSGSKPSRRFLTSRSLGVKSGMRWILTMRSPTTCKAQCHQHTKLTPLQSAWQQG